MSYPKGWLSWWLVVLLFLPVVSCSSGDKPVAEDSVVSRKKVHVNVEELISHLPADVLHGGGTIRIRFHGEQAGPHQVGVMMIKSDFSFQPPIEGYQAWFDSHTIVFYPYNKLEGNTEYTSVLDVESLIPGIEIDKEVMFTFRVAGQEVDEVSPVFSSVPGGEPNQVIIVVEVRFTEPIDVDQAASLINLTVDGRRIEFELSLGENARTLELRSEIIEKTAKYRSIALTVDRELAGPEDFIRGFSLPPDKKFEVSSLIVVDGDGEEEIGMDILFSEQLDQSRDYSGFVSSEPEVELKVDARDRLLRLRGAFERGIEYTIILQPGITNISGEKTLDTVRKQATFNHLDPQVKFDQSGVILPFSGRRSISFRSVNVDSLTFSIQQVYASNLGQFLQANELVAPASQEYGYSSMRRVATEVHHQVLKPGGQSDTWERTELELGDLLEKERRAAFVVRLRGWDGRGRQYIRHKLLISTDLGITTKWSGEKLHVYVSSIRGSGPVSGARVALYSQQLQELDSGWTDSDGQVVFDNDEDAALYVAVEDGQDRSYLRTFRDSWKTSSFETGGVDVHSDGVNAFIYTDRGVYRPEDTVHISCIARNRQGTFPEAHPVKLKLYNPRGQLTETLISSEGRNGLYYFSIPGNSSDMTGSWQAELLVGDRTFRKEIKRETVIPNRLKVELAFSDTVSTGEFPVEITSRWLFGAPADGLRGESELWLQPAERTFRRYPEFVFSNPLLQFEPSREMLWEGELDSEGKVSFTADPPETDQMPSAMQGFIRTRVFEKGGNFTEEVSPVFVETYETFTGLQPVRPRWGGLKAGESHRVPVVVLDRLGKPVPGHALKVTVYRNYRYWWWDYESERSDRLRYRRNIHTRQMSETYLISSSAPVEFTFEPEQYGQYFIEIEDEDSGHSAGWMVFVSSWGDSGQDTPQRADVLRINSDRKVYAPGETARIRVETPATGTALVTLEKGGEILWSRWLEVDGPMLDFDVPVNRRMLPNAYVSVSLLQPLMERNNDLPLRMYGIIPLMVEDAHTHLPLVLRAADELAPDKEFEVEISLADNREGWATVAVVDEGLLDLTDFETPDPWNHFYAKERLSVETSDLFDNVLDVIRGDISQRYTVGGDFDTARRKRAGPDQGKRFHPVALFSGPVYIRPGAGTKVSFKMPNYIGSVRVMALALSDDAYATTDKTIPVKSPLIVLPTVPRVIGPDEEFKLPVTVFAMDEQIKKAELRLKTDSLLTIIGPDVLSLSFAAPGDTIVHFRVRAAKAVGSAEIRIEAVAGNHRAGEIINLNVRPANPLITVSRDTVLTGEAPLLIEIPRVGLAGTNTTRLTVSTTPEFNLSSRLAYLIRYPYGCLEQTTSSVFPQLYLRDLVALDAAERVEIDNNINEAIKKLRRFQHEDGGFSFWPGGSYQQSYSWAHAYAGHFLLAARQKGYHVPDDMLRRWLVSTRNTVRQWPQESWQYKVQAYNLFLLALAEKNQRGMMNWLRENRLHYLDTLGGWLLAASYHISGKQETAKLLLDKLNTEVGDYREFGLTYGSTLRDRAMILYLADMMGLEVVVAKLVNELAQTLKDSRRYYSTQETAMVLLALGRYLEKHGTPQVPAQVEMQIGSGQAAPLELTGGRCIIELTGHEGQSLILNARTETPLYVELSSDGIPLERNIQSEHFGLSLDVEWLDEDGAVIDPVSLQQGESFWAKFTVGKSSEEDISEIALSAVFPSGWEIDNSRLNEASRPAWMENLHLAEVDYTDIRDDRVNWFFDLPEREYNQINAYDFLVRLTAVYAGKYYLPAFSAEAMYNPGYYARQPGRWVEVRGIE